MEASSTQALFFQHIKNLLPPHLSMVDEIADLLQISNDSAYRRIRGEKGVSLEEMQKLASHYKISIDQFLHIETDSFLFSGKLAGYSNDYYEEWMQSVLKAVYFMNNFQRKHMYYLAKDVPVMYAFAIPELQVFKSFFWRKSILHVEEMRGVKFNLKQLNQPQLELGKKIIQAYNQVPTTEIWNVESINSTIRQIEFYRESNIFENVNDVAVIYQALFNLVDHLEKQAEIGLKFEIGGKPGSNAATFALFNNELILGDNTILVEVDNSMATWLNHSVINFIQTRDKRFNSYMYESMQNLIHKSTQLSIVGEKERVRFFNRIRDKMKLAARL